jgi:hypothetical protein
VEDKALLNIQDELPDFIEHLQEIDEIAQIILKGHLHVEQQLERILTYMFFYGDYALKARIGFDQRIQLIKGWSAFHEHEHWEFISALNQLRNEIAHKSPGEARKKKIEDVRQMFIKACIPSVREQYKSAADSTITLYLCATASGFLEKIHDDILDMRQRIDAMAQTVWNEQRKASPSSEDG